MTGNAQIVQLYRGVDVWFWLCRLHLKRKVAEGWELRVNKVPPHPLACDDCRRETA